MSSMKERAQSTQQSEIRYLPYDSTVISKMIPGRSFGVHVATMKLANTIVLVLSLCIQGCAAQNMNYRIFPAAQVELYGDDDSPILGIINPKQVNKNRVFCFTSFLVFEYSSHFLFYR